MQTAAIFVWIYGALVLIGGVMGFVKARSQASLVSGSIFGALLIADGLVMLNPKLLSFGIWTALLLAGLLTVIMGIRFAKSKKFMPAGLVCGLSAVMCALFSYLLP